MLFGHNIKDAFGQPLYKELSFEELENLCNGMVAFARSQPPFDFSKAVAEAKENSKLDTEPVGPMLRVRGNDIMKSTAEYTKFIQLGIHALQISYYEMETPEMGRVGQMTLVSNYKFPLEGSLIAGFAELFFGDEWGKVKLMETPSHVAVGILVIRGNDD
jgi:hypothetical protein